MIDFKMTIPCFGYGTAIKAEYDLSDGTYITPKITNISGETVKIGKIYCIKDAAVKINSEFGITVIYEAGWGNDGNRVVSPEADGSYKSVIWGGIYDKSSRGFLHVAFVTFDRVDCIIEFNFRDGSPYLDCYCDFHGFELAAGQTVAGETLRIVTAGYFGDALKTWADEVSAHYRPKIAPKPALGAVGVWTWTNALGVNCGYEEKVLRNAKALSERLRGFGFEYYWVSIGNLKGCVPGNWLENNDRQFPGGIENLPAKLREQGLKLGLWFAPFWIPDRFTDFDRLHENQILKRGGKKLVYPTRWLYELSAAYPPGERLNFYCRDGSSPDAAEYVKSVLRYYHGIGVRYYMVDFLISGAGETYGPCGYDEYSDRSKINGPEAYRFMMQAVREAAGSDTYLVASTGPSMTNIGCVDATRTGPDTGEGRPAFKDGSSYPATFCTESYDMLRLACNNYAHYYHQHGKLYHCDSFNVVTVDKPVPLDIVRMTLSMAALSSSAMMLGDEIYEMSGERLAMLKKALPQNTGEAAVPEDLPDSVYPEIPGKYHLSVHRRWGSYDVYGLLNLGENDREFKIDLNGASVVYDFWNESFEGIYTGIYSCKVSKRDIKVLRVSPLSDHPQLLSTDMHILQGAVEVRNVDWDEGECRLAVTCTRPEGETGTVILLVPKEYVPCDYEGIHTAMTGGGKHYILTKHLHFDVVTRVFGIKFIKKD